MMIATERNWGNFLPPTKACNKLFYLIPYIFNPRKVLKVKTYNQS